MNAPAELRSVGAIDRATYIGGSDIAAIMGVSPWRTPLDVYLSKVGEAPPPAVPDPERERRLRRGKRMEPYIIDMLAEDHGITILRRSTDEAPNRYVDTAFPFMAAEVDFEWNDAADPRVRNGEVKTVAVRPGGGTDWGDEGTDEVPIYYAAQGLWGLGITSRELCQFAVLFGMDNLSLYAIAREGNEELIADMREQARRFWVEHVIPRVPPPPRTFEDLAKLWPKDSGASVEADEKCAAWVATYETLRDRERIACEGKEAVEYLIAEFMRDATTLTHKGSPLATYKAQATTSIAATALKEALPEVYAQFVRRGTTRVLRLK